MEGDEVVSVHNGVDKTIQNNGQVNITVISDIGVQPIELQEKIGHYLNTSNKTLQ